MGKEEPEGLSRAALVELTEAAEAESEMLLELLIAEQDARATDTSASRTPERIDGVVVGVVTALSPSGLPTVTFPGSPSEGIDARAIAPISAEDIGREVALMFEGGDPTRPLLMGRMHGPSAVRKAEVESDGDRLELTAEKEIVLRCGDASITLTRAGKILIRGAYLVSRSSGVNRILGGSVEIN